MKKQPRPQFFAIYKSFSDGKIKPYDVLETVFNEILTPRGTIKKSQFYIFDQKWNRINVRTKEQCEKFVKDTLKYHFWSKCEWEFIVVDWPYRDTIENSRPVKIDVWDQLEPNLPLINELVWNYIEPKVKKLIKNE